MENPISSLQERFNKDNDSWRNPMDVIAAWSDSSRIPESALDYHADSGFWAAVEAANVSLAVTREYEHFIFALRVRNGHGDVSFMRLPHPSGVAHDPERTVVHVASTRNPNQIVVFAPVYEMLERNDPSMEIEPLEPGSLVPIEALFLPGATYLHDLAMIGDRLYANSVGCNLVGNVVGGAFQPAWWPRCIEIEGVPVTDRNYIQLNSIAAGESLDSSYFTATCDELGELRIGDPLFPVDKRGVVFDGKSRDVCARGLTRPHSAKINGGRLFVNNSGYGEFGYIADERLQTIRRMPGWTRGLGLGGDYAFVGTSRIIPRFAAYAPGVDVSTSVCAIHAINLTTGDLEGSFTWPAGNQIFAIEPLPPEWHFPYNQRAALTNAKSLFYGFALGGLHKS